MNVMIKLYYAGGSIEVGDEVAESIMSYAHALADVKRSDLVTIPAIAEDGTRGVARLLIGPSSELLASPIADKGVDLNDDPLLEELRMKVAALQPSRPMASENSTSNVDHDL
ncbi:MAG: hypothetical protein QOF79_671 [Actinomycetota bacterium]|jgi:hypothetical protein|nr:hypothetical protein [Actinomycetota bacterium]